MGHRRIEILILVFTILLIAAVLLVGLATFKNMGVIEKQSQKINQPNKTIFTLKALLSELRNSENCVRSYNLYRNEEFLLDYQHSLERTDEYIDELYSYQTVSGSISLLDSVRFYTEQKILLLNEQLSLRKEEELIKQIDRVKNKIEKVSAKDTLIIISSATPESDKKRNFFSRLFRGKPEAKTDTLRVVLNKHSLEDIKSEILAVQKNQSLMLSEMKQKEMDLMKQDKEVWAKLLNTLTQMEDQQTLLLKTIADENIRETEKTNRLTKSFGVLILVMLCSLAFFSLYYFYTGRKYRQKLNNTVSEAQMLARARESFLANMSHEMRTPLNAIKGFTEQLGQSRLDAEQKKQLGIINTASKHLLNLINDILDLSKIEADKIEFEKIPFNPVETVNEAVGFLKPRASDKKINTILDIHPSVSLIISGDPLRLRQVILNLYSNAIKFTKEGKITIRVFTQPVPASNGNKILLCFSVEDTGIGISENMIGKVFDNFTQADTSITRKYGGTGLGLSITKKIIELQSGEILVSSTLGKGSKFSVRIPYPVSEAAAPNKNSEEKISPVPATAKGKRVLVADDELFNRMLLTTILKRWNIQFDEAENGKEAVEKVKANTYDMILMDVRMPEMSGIDASVAIRALADHKKAAVPIIALTAVTLQEKKEKCLEAGMNELITKPYNEKELVDLMNRFFNPGK